MDEARYAKRTRKACDPCRRKKSKCPGERPACSYCERLGQPCFYSATNEASDTQPAQQDTQPARQGTEVENRLSSLEDKMDRLIQHLSSDPPPGRPLPPAHVPSSNSTNPVQEPHQRDQVGPTPRGEYPVSAGLHRPDHPPMAQAASTSVSAVTESQLMETGRLYLTWCHNQPITLFSEDNFVESLASRDPELILSLQALAMRFPPGSLTLEVSEELKSKAKSARCIIMDRVMEGRIELSTLQSLCLLSMFDFASGNVTQSGLNLSIASHLAHSIPPSSNPGNAKERDYCLRSIAALQNLQGCITPATKLMNNLPASHNPGHAFSIMAACTTPELSSNQLGDIPDRDISTLAAHFSVTWRMARAYAASRVGPDAPPPWDSRSDYSMVMQSHHDIDCRASVKYRFACNRIDRHAPEAIQAQRQWWMPFLFIQFVHETIPCLLNHPFLLSMRLRSFRQTIPVHFMQHSFEAINRNAGWVVYFIDVLDKKGVQVSDPILAHCVVIVATIHLQHSFVQDAVFREKAQTGFDKCMNFLKRMGEFWPCVANMAENLRKLQGSVVMKPFSDQQDGSSQAGSFTINSQLLWDLLIYDRAVRPDGGWDQSIFGPTLTSDVSELSTEGRAADFDLVGSEGISAHKAMPNQAAVWPPNEDAPLVGVPQAQPLGSSAGAMGTSFEDVFFEGVGPFGDQTNRFFDGEDYGRAIDDWLNLGM